VAQFWKRWLPAQVMQIVEAVEKVNLLRSRRVGRKCSLSGRSVYDDLMLGKAKRFGSKESGGYMKKARKTEKNELRPEYKRSDFTGPLVRGKYAKRLRESSNIVVLKPEVAEVFPNEESVNSALLSLMKLAKKTTRLKRSSGRSKARAA
jgi:hypothetical protein